MLAAQGRNARIENADFPAGRARPADHFRAKVLTPPLPSAHNLGPEEEPRP